MGEYGNNNRMSYSLDSIPHFHLGPVSRCTVDAAIQVAYRHQKPLCLIASRRQIETATLGGGYVNNWSTEDFAKYVRERDPKNLITLARDHGGPFQRPAEMGLSPQHAIRVAMVSFGADIRAGFKILHLDPEKAVTRDDLQGFINHTIELMVQSDRLAKSKGIEDVTFEIGTDEGIGEDLCTDQWDRFLDQVMTVSLRERTNQPVTFAVPMGTKTKEIRNVGEFVTCEDNHQVNAWEKRIDELHALANRYNLHLKLHNGDYMPQSAVRRFIERGVTHINVAPEFGVVESQTWLRIMRENSMNAMADELEQMAIVSGKWDRWLLPHSRASNHEKALMAGHYIFAMPAAIELRAQAQRELAKRGVDLEKSLLMALTQIIEHYFLPINNIEHECATTTSFAA